MSLHRGEIYLVDLNNHVGSEQSGIRPAIIVQNEVGNTHSPTTIVCPLTSQTKTPIATHVEVTPEDCGILKDSTILCEQICVIDKTLVKRKLGELKNQEKLREFNHKLLISLGIIEHEKFEAD